MYRISRVAPSPGRSGEWIWSLRSAKVRILAIRRLQVRGDPASRLWSLRIARMRTLPIRRLHNALAGHRNFLAARTRAAEMELQRQAAHGDQKESLTTRTAPNRHPVTRAIRLEGWHFFPAADKHSLNAVWRHKKSLTVQNTLFVEMEPQMDSPEAGVATGIHF